MQQATLCPSRCLAYQPTPKSTSNTTSIQMSGTPAYTKVNKQHYVHPDAWHTSLHQIQQGTLCPSRCLAHRPTLKSTSNTMSIQMPGKPAYTKVNKQHYVHPDAWHTSLHQRQQATLCSSRCLPYQHTRKSTSNTMSI